jgi:NAD-dependent SIR2 family protein deacetylase
MSPTGLGHMTKRVFFFGAGASIEAGIPMASQLVERIINTSLDNLRFSHFTEPGVAKLAQNFVRDFVRSKAAQWRTGSIEELLNLATAADRLRFSLPFGARLVEASWVVGLLTWMSVLLIDETKPIAEPYTSFASLLSEEDTLITLNYDTVCERYVQTRFASYDYALGERAEVRANRPTETVEKDEGNNAWIVTASPEEPVKSSVEVDRGIGILKLHGSLNWRRCVSSDGQDNCGKLFVYQSTFPAFGYVSHTYCECEKGTLSPIIVPPALLKDVNAPAVKYVWDRAIRTLLQADDVLIIGYSMPTYDVMIEQLFRLLAMHNPKLHFHVVNPSLNVFRRFSFISRKRRTLHQTTFGGFVGELQTV